MKKNQLFQAFFLLVITGILFIGSFIALGIPDFSAVGDIFYKNNVTSYGLIALVSIFVWLFVLGIGFFLILLSIKSVKASKRTTLAIQREAMLVLMVGVLIFGIGLFHHLTINSEQCCGSIQEASQLAR